MARSQVLAVAILGAWIMSTLCMWFAATRSFATVERVRKVASRICGKSPNLLAEPRRAWCCATWVRRSIARFSRATECSRSGSERFCSSWSAAITASRAGYQPGGNHAGPVSNRDAGPKHRSLPRSDAASISYRAIPLPQSCRASGCCTGHSHRWTGVKLLAGIGLMVRWIFT